MVAELCDPIVCQGVVISLLEALIQPQNKQSWNLSVKRRTYVHYFEML